MRPSAQLEYDRPIFREPLPDIYPADVNFGRPTTDEPDPETIFEELRQPGEPEAQLSAGELAVRQARSTSEDTEALMWLQRAEHSFHEVAKLTESSAEKPILSFLGAKAILHSAQLPNYIDMVTSGKLPNPSVAGLAYVRSVEVATQIRAGIVTRRMSGEDALHRVGLLAKTNVLLLGQRYALSEHRDQSWFPVWSFADEVQDVTVLTDIGEGISTSYRVKVKSSERAAARDAITYADDISVVCLDPQLKFNNERFPTRRIASDLLAERQGNEDATRRLDARTQKLLDILG